MNGIMENKRDTKSTKILEKKNIVATLLSVLIMALSVVFAYKSVTTPFLSFGNNVYQTKQGLIFVEFPELQPSQGMQQFRYHEKQFLTIQNNLGSLLQWKSRDQEIMISYTDMLYLPVFLMFYEGVIQKRLSNFLAFVTEEEAYKELISRNIPVYFLRGSRTKPKVSSQQTDENKFMLYKTMMIQSVIDLGYNVLYSDIDIILFMNPFKNMVGKGEQHLLTESVNDQFGTGFMYITSNDQTIALFRLVYEALQAFQTKTDWELMQYFIANKTISDLKAKKLNTKFYQEGNIFYKTHQFYGDIYPNYLVMIHNNHVQGRHNKLYLFNEMRLVDYEENGYYSNSNNVYITVKHINPLSTEADISALIRLSQILQRIIILPALPCAEMISAPECNLCGFRPDDCWKSFQDIRRGYWREHTFLRSVLVSREIQYEALHDTVLTFEKEKKGVDGYEYIPTQFALHRNEVSELFAPFAYRHILTLDTIPFSFLK